MKKLGKNALTNLTLDTTCQIDLGSNVTAVDSSNYNSNILWGVNHNNPIVNDLEFREQKYTISDSEGVVDPSNDGATKIDYAQIKNNKAILQAYKLCSDDKIRRCKAYYPIDVTSHDLTKLSNEIKASRNKITEVFIPHIVQQLVNEVFVYTQIKEIEIPDSVTNLGVQIFGYCTNLENIEIPDSVTSLGAKAFYNCTSLESVKLSKEITLIGGYTFYNCSSLKNIVIPDKVITINDYAFAGCTNLENVKISNSVTAIGKSVFSNTNLKSITIPSNVTGIGANTFYNCNNLKTITINKEANSIEGSPWGATNVEEIIWEE